MEVTQFDARTAKALKPRDHLTFAPAPGLQLKATGTRRTWTYRYKSPVDNRMRQIRIGAWPAMSYAAALDAGRLPDNTPNWWRLIMRGRLRSKGKRIAGQHIGETKRVLSDKEVGELIPWLPNFTQLLEDVLTLYLWTMCRGAEIVAMEG